MNSEQWDARYSESGLLWSKGPNQFLVEQVKDLPPGRCLDLACGEGRNAIWLAENGWHVTASDFSPVAIQKARKRSEELGLDIQWQVADVLQPTEGIFDLVIVFYLHLVPDQMRVALQHAASVLAPGGTLLLVAHDARNIEDGWGGPQEPSILYGPSDVVEMLPGLSIHIAKTIERHVVEDGVEHVALDVMVRATRAAT